ncbi:MAG: tetratricopeptide repeat protein, partial [Verrucomicrobiota bacterium]|nr:tetratricopeptide repeat protein [Verrucomicrobiota bacterium]
YRAYLNTTPRPTNFSEVELLARQLESELNPAARANHATAQTVPVISTQPATNLLTRAAVPAEIKPTTNSQSKQTSLPPRVVLPNPIAPPVSVTQVPEEQPLKPVQDIPSDSEKSAASLTNLPAAHTVSNGLRKKPAPSLIPLTNATPRMVSTNAPGNLSSITPLRSHPPLARYKYLSPGKPLAGNRREATRLFAQGAQAQREGHLSEAITAYQNANRADPSFFEAYYNLSLAAYESGNLSLSLLACEKALAIQPDAVNARYNFGLTLQKANFPQDAANELEKVLKENPNETRAHLALANLYAQQLYQMPLARQHYLQVLELEPRHPQAGAIRNWLAANP